MLRSPVREIMVRPLRRPRPLGEYIISTSHAHPNRPVGRPVRRLTNG